MIFSLYSCSFKHLVSSQCVQNHKYREQFSLEDQFVYVYAPAYP